MDSILDYVSEERDVLYMRGQEKVQNQFVTYLLREGDKTPEQVAEIAGVSVDFVKSVKQKMSEN